MPAAEIAQEPSPATAPRDDLIVLPVSVVVTRKPCKGKAFTAYIRHSADRKRFVAGQSITISREYESNVRKLASLIQEMPLCFTLSQSSESADTYSMCKLHGGSCSYIHITCIGKK